MAITEIVAAARKSNPDLATELKRCSSPVQREVLAYFRGYVPRPDVPGYRDGQPMPVPTREPNTGLCGNGFGDILPVPYITPVYLGALLGRQPHAVLRAVKALQSAKLLAEPFYGPKGGEHVYSPMTLLSRADTQPNIGPLPFPSEPYADDLPFTCPYGGYMYATLDMQGEITTEYHARVHEDGSPTCPFSEHYHPDTNPELTRGKCAVTSIHDGNATTMRLHVPTRKGPRRHSITHPMFHAYYPEATGQNCPWHVDYSDSPDFPWSDLNPDNAARLDAWKREQDTQLAANTHEANTPRTGRDRLKAFLTAPDAATGLARAFRK